jgi:acetyl esterase/lipase
VTPHPLCYAAALLAASVCLGTPRDPIPLWPGPPPGDPGGLPAEHDTQKPTDTLVGGRTVMKIANVSTPTLTFYAAPADKANGTTVVVFPGGGYYILAWDLEGTEVCDWLNGIGVNAVLIKYRVPRRAGRAPSAAPLEDAQRAVGLTRLHAKDWGVNPDKIGTLGFSAGGNLCAVLAASTARTYPKVDAADDQSFAPNFQVLVYPAYLAKDEVGPGLQPEVAVTGTTPPTFMVMAEDDPVHVENVYAYGLALKAAKVPTELHVYPTGGHGYGLRPTKDNVTTWPLRVADWMQRAGLLDRP